MTQSESGARGKESDFSQMKVQEVIKLLGSDVDAGLKSSQVESQLKLYGYNEVIEKKTSPLMTFVKKFWGLTSCKK
jgi:H+-transporting ATPase